MCAPDIRVSLHRRRRQHGVSLIELMVGIVIAMLVGLAAVGSASFFTASQRQGIGAGGAIVSATTALAVMKEEAAQAGLGFFGDVRYLCDDLNLSVGAQDLSEDDFSPVRITRDEAFDQIDLVSANEVAGGASVLLSAASNGGGAELETFLPAAAGQAVLMAPAGQVVGTCTVRTVTAVTPRTALAPLTLTFAADGLHNQVAFDSPATYPVRGRLSLLGAVAWSRYRVENGNLVLERPLGEGDPVVLVRDVVGFRAQYGVAADTALVPGSNTTTIATWEEPEGDFATVDTSNIARVRALRIGLVLRSPQPEKRNAAGECTATASMPQLFGADVAIDEDDTDWNCFRYRTVTAVVPMRNVVMGLR